MNYSLSGSAKDPDQTQGNVVRITINTINVYCDTLTRDTHAYGGVSVNCGTTIEELTQLITHIPAPSFVKKIALHERALSDDESEGTIDIYVSYQLKRKPITHKKTLEPDEITEVEGLLTTIRMMLEHLGTVAPQQARV